MKLVYTVEINEDIYGLDSLLNTLNEAVNDEGFEVKASKLESDEEIAEY